MQRTPSPQAARGSARRHVLILVILLSLTWSNTHPIHAQTSPTPQRVVQIRAIDPNVLPTDDESKKIHERALHEHVRAMIDRANRESTLAWRDVQARDQWETFRREKRDVLQRAIGTFPEGHRVLSTYITRELPGDGYAIRNVIYESRPGLFVTANLYSPDPLPTKSKSAPGILIVHSHHNPKTQSELQDMGVMWSRVGCHVLVPDQLGHGERRQHPFVSADDYSGSFRVSRQDYYFRYNVGMQLSLIGDALVGWMAWDNMLGFDVLLDQPGIDADRLIILGAVAGGGDPCAVTAALDDRIDAAVPFNFGGPQPETRFPLPQDAEMRFNYAGSGSWESTRNIQFAAARGALPWVIVGSVAPRPLVYAHEFAWDRENDPVWKRYERIWGDFYGVRDKLTSTHGYGNVRLSSKEASHCNNIGTHHRKAIHGAFKRWFDIPLPDENNRSRHDSADLLCWTDAWRERLQPKPARDVAKATIARPLPPGRQPYTVPLSREMAHKVWSRRLGIDGDLPSIVMDTKKVDDVVTRCVIRFGDVPVPMLLLRDGSKAEGRSPVVIMLAQGGKASFLRERAAAIAAMLDAGVAVCLPDLRGCGETSPGSGRSQWSWSTSIASTALMVGKPIMGQRLTDLRAVFASLAKLDGIDTDRIALWGDAFTEPNAPDRDMKVPLRIDQPNHAEPLGGLLAMLAALDRPEQVKAIYVRNGLADFTSALDSPFIHIPYDTVVPGVLRHGDIPDIAASLAPTPLWMQGMVSAQNKRVNDDALRATYESVSNAYRKADQPDAIRMQSTVTDDALVARWMIDQLQRDP